MQEEEILGKAYDHRLMRRLLTYLRPYRRHVALGIALSMVVSGMEAFRPWFVKRAVDVDIAGATPPASSGPPSACWPCCSSGASCSSATATSPSGSASAPSSTSASRSSG